MNTSVSLSDPRWDGPHVAGLRELAAEVSTGISPGIDGGVTSLRILAPTGERGAIEIETQDIPALCAVLMAHHEVWKQRRTR